MNERFRLNCAHILVLSILLHSFTSHCYPQFLKDASSNADDSNHVIEEQPNKLDPSIEQIFRGPSDRKNRLTNSKRNTETETSKTAVQPDEIDKRARIKRESVMKSGNAKSLNGGTKSNEKRSSSKANEAASRTSRSSRELPALPEKDYEISVDQDKSEYLDESEDESAVGPKSAGSKYRGSEFHVGEDSEKYIDQEERSSLYDDFEAKDVVKRGISGAEDYEEIDEDSIGSAEDNVAVEERGMPNEEVDKEKVHGDVRVKREPESSKGADSAVAGEKAENAGIASDLYSDSKIAGTAARGGAPGGKDSEIAENQENKVEKETDEQGEQQSKRNVADKIESNICKVNPDRVVDIPKKALTGNDQTEVIESNESAKLQNQENQDTMVDKKTQEASLSSKERVLNDALGETPSLKAFSSTNSDESKIIDVPNPEATKLEVPVNALDNAPSEDTAKLENSKSDAATGGQLDGDCEKRVEEQIQRKIDSIKEEIKREIVENQRVRDIEENNAKFDELREQEEDDGEDAIEAESSEKRSNLSKRSLENSGKSLARDTPEKRLIKRKKRQGETGQEKGASESDSRKKARRATAKKRSVAKSEQSSTLNELPKKREYSREVFLVKRDSNAAKKKRKVRSKNAILIPEQRSVKLNENLHEVFALDPSVREELGGGKSSLSKMSEDEKATAEQDSLLEKKLGSVSSLTGTNGEMGPLATEYGEAFGGLHGEPGVALARFKRIKRVLRPTASKS